MEITVKILLHTIVVTSILTSAALAQKNEEKTLSESDFKRLHSSLNPGQQTWKTIPWRIDLIQAQNEAAKQKKLLAIWTMDGHPLGCT